MSLPFEKNALNNFDVMNEVDVTQGLKLDVPRWLGCTGCSDPMSGVFCTRAVEFVNTQPEDTCLCLSYFLELRLQIITAIRITAIIVERCGYKFQRLLERKSNWTH